MVGVAARFSGGKIGRVTGLDPGRRWFRTGEGAGKRLKKSDADLVDVIHTNGGGTSSCK